MEIASLLTPSLPVPCPPAPPPTPRLLSLPNEILAVIFDHVVAPLILPELPRAVVVHPDTGVVAAYDGDLRTARRTVLSACLVCRHLCGPAREALYRNVTISSGRDLVLLLRTLLRSGYVDGARNGALVSPLLVRHIACRAVLDDPGTNMDATNTWDQIRHGLVPDATETMVLAALELPSPDCRESRATSYLSSKHVDWTVQRLFAAVLALSPGLRSLLIEDPSDEYSVLNSCLATLLQHDQLRGRILPNFTKIITRTDGRRHGIDLVLSSFLELGTTRAYHSHYGPEPFSLRPRQSPPPACLESITMTCCVAPGVILLTVADMCSRLQRLDLSALTWHRVDAEVFDSHLPKLASNLLEFSLRVHTTYGQEARSRLSCLPQMINLAVLTIEVDILVGDMSDVENNEIAQRLPPNLEHLTVLGAKGGFEKDPAPVGRLLQAAWDIPQRLPKLREFFYMGASCDVLDEESSSILQEITSRFARGGITFGLDSNRR